MDEIATDRLLNVCVLTKSRRAARAVSRHYGRLLEPHGLTPPQASLLFILLKSDAKSVSALSEKMGIERSALTRNLRLLEEAGLVGCEIGGRGGAKAYRLTERGQDKIVRLIPVWREAQDTLHEKFGEVRWDRMQSALATLGTL